jgi:hypothetical protein
MLDSINTPALGALRNNLATHTYTRHTVIPSNGPVTETNPSSPGLVTTLQPVAVHDCAACPFIEGVAFVQRKHMVQIRAPRDVQAYIIHIS